jgi:hypothetical protein
MIPARWPDNLSVKRKKHIGLREIPETLIPELGLCIQLI